MKQSKHNNVAFESFQFEIQKIHAIVGELQSNCSAKVVSMAKNNHYFQNDTSYCKVEGIIKLFFLKSVEKVTTAMGF